MLSNLMSENQTILAIETSTTGCSAAILVQSPSGSIVYESWKDAPRQHTDLILPMLDEVLEQANCTLLDIDVLAFGCGPGAFTGVRIATSVIQAISYAADIKVISVSSLAALAQGAYRTQGRVDNNSEANAENCVENQPDNVYQNIVVASDARMNEVYLACYKIYNANMTLIGEEKLLKPENIGSSIEQFCKDNPQWLAIGSGWSAYQDVIEPQLSDFPYRAMFSDCLPHAQDIAELAINKLANNQYGDALTALPVYLRNDVAKKSVDQKSAAQKMVKI